MSECYMLKNKLKKIGFVSLSGLLIVLSAGCNNDNTNKDANSQKNDMPTDKMMAMKSNHNEGSVEKIKWYSYNEGIKKATLEKKPVVIDFYTDWCTYCKKMEAETYSEKKVYNYLNEKFVTIKVNAESKNKIKFDGKEMTEQELAMGFGVNSYPTVFFMESEKNTIGTAPGYIEAPQFYAISTYVGSNAYKTMTLEKYREKQKI